MARSRKVRITYEGRSITLRKLWYECGCIVPFRTVSTRYKKGMDPYEACTKTVRPKAAPKATDRKTITETLTKAAIDWAVIEKRLGVNQEISVTFGSKRLRVDLLGVTYATLEFTGFEVKSGHEDFRADKKWMNYLEHCERFYLVITEDYYASDKGKEAVKAVRAKGCGVLVLMNSTGYCTVKHYAKKLPGLDAEDKNRLISKILWKNAEVNRASLTRRTRRYL